MPTDRHSFVACQQNLPPPLLLFRLLALSRCYQGSCVRKYVHARQRKETELSSIVTRAVAIAVTQCQFFATDEREPPQALTNAQAAELPSLSLSLSPSSGHSARDLMLREVPELSATVAAGRLCPFLKLYPTPFALSETL